MALLAKPENDSNDLSSQRATMHLRIENTKRLYAWRLKSKIHDPAWGKEPSWPPWLATTLATKHPVFLYE